MKSDEVQLSYGAGDANVAWPVLPGEPAAEAGFDLHKILAPLWNRSLGDPRIRIAVIDGNVDLAAPSLKGASLRSVMPPTMRRQFRSSEHGTHIASLIFGCHDGPVPGIAPHCSGILLPIFAGTEATHDAPCSQQELAAAIDRARAEGAHIINISAGAFTPEGLAEHCLEEALARCEEAGTLVIAATGNQGGECAQVPAALLTVLAVGATDASGNVLPLSNWGNAYDRHGIVAPGSRIPGEGGDGTIRLGDGTSYATAIVSGVAALLLSIQLQAGSQPRPLEVRQVLLDTAIRRPHDTPQVLQGRLNAEGALAGILKMLASAPQFMQPAELAAASASSQSTSQQLTFTGVWQPAPAALQDFYAGVPQDQFGCTEILSAQNQSHRVADLHYPLPAGHTGMRFLPVRDDEALLLPDGSVAAGYQLIDTLLRDLSSLDTNAPIYALISYIRPDEHKVALEQLFNTYKRRLGHQHIGAYLGQGRTTQALPDYRLAEWAKCGYDYLWNVRGRPANVHVLSLQGVAQETLNRNCQLADLILSRGVRVPGHTETLRCKTYDLNTILQFYRDWILDADYLHELDWYTNCADHKMVVVNVALNLPHNPAMFEAVFGAEEGKTLWAAFLQKYAQLTGSPLSPQGWTTFVPLWQLEGLHADQIRPLPLADYYRYHAARREQRLDRYTGPHPLAPGRGMAWPPETLVDLVVAVLDTYANVMDVGGVTAALTLLSLEAPLAKLFGWVTADYPQLVEPALEALLEADARMHAAHNPRWLEDTGQALYQGLSRVVGTTEAQDAVPAQVEAYLHNLRPKLDNIVASGGMRAEAAYAWLCAALARYFERIRQHAIAGQGIAEFFTTPCIVQRIACGKYPKSRFVQVRTVCTVMDDRELEYVPAALAALVYLNTLPPDSEKEGTMPTIIDPNNPINPTNSTETKSGGDPGKPPAGSPATGSPGTDGQGAQNSGAAGCNCTCQGSNAPPQLVYALGRLGYDFISLSRRDSLQQKLASSGSVENVAQLLDYLDKNPWDAAAIQWLLLIENTPVYVIQPQGPFARDAYDLLRQFLREQLTENVERVSIPGVIIGSEPLRSGYTVPVISPEIRGMYNWTTAALVERMLGGKPPAKTASQETRDAFTKVATGVHGFLERVYYELRNSGQTPQERALNFAATSAFQIEKVYESAMRQNMELDTIEVERNPIGRPGADCWDVQLYFFYPEGKVQATRKAYRFTVDVTDVVPVTFGDVRSWFIR